jgi:hypothetical protein
MTNPNHNWDEERLAQLLRAAQQPPLPPDERFLARLRAQSSEAFQSSAIHTPTVETSTVETSTSETNRSIRKSKMLILAWRGLASAAAVIVAAATLFMASDSGGKAVPLAALLEKTETSAALHLRIERSGEPVPSALRTTEAWSSRGEKLRVNHSDGTYDIGLKEKLWQIDEKANRATSGPSLYYRPTAASKNAASKNTASTASKNTAAMALDLLRFLGLNTFASAAVEPIRDKVGDKSCDLYRYETSRDGRPLWVEARVDPATHLLYSLETQVDRDGKRTPLVTLTVLDVNQPVNEELFVVGNTLTEDGRIGKVTDSQGMVSIKPVMAERWTPVCGKILLKPGDWLRTDLRGANALAARLVGKAQIVMGPGSQVELISPKSVRLDFGEIKVAADPTSPLKLLGPGGESLEVKNAGVYRIKEDAASKGRLVLLNGEPKWLKGFEGAEVQESIGSLVATVDGRNVPLTVGYHKVTVEIRDQIARTTVEESFANLTDHALEGVFYFPLPQDASISGFGMWIGNELVEADIVEKQRAREIYETIKRERRDPGLLEWSGGNLFTARVFPIEAHAEKRIRISYTQVLPLAGNTFRYSYALQSEMLKQHPLRELSIAVTINSAVPLKKVASPTHTVRSDQTAHSAHVDFAAQEYTPTRDFEVVAELDGGAGVSPALAAGTAAPLTLIPHRRGDDGYFMLLVTPPAKDADDDRDLLTDKTPLDLIILADTSASLDAGQRARQAEFIAAVLGSLTPRDTLNLACFDVDCDWAFEKAVSPNAKNIEIARRFLDRRASLGWTDLAQAFTQAFERAGRNSCILYVGDGIPTVGDADPAAMAAQLRRLYTEKCQEKKPVCHAVAVGSTFESGVLKAIVGLGGGSMRQISGEQGPRQVALDLLKEITRPAIRDLKVQFSGLRVARVYPDPLPNLPAGSQQILLGRYLPQGAAQSGMVTVTGRQLDRDRGDREIRFEKAVSLADAEQGNSFIPRLWARMHLDSLLQQGATPAIKEDIIALSEDYHIITPYTSLLVLETDADRERFKVKRAFTMRDGEKFFAAGHDNADFDLTQQQMKRAGSWRKGLRMTVLQQLSGLGRNASVFQRHGSEEFAIRELGRAGDLYFADINGLGIERGGTLELGNLSVMSSLEGAPASMSAPMSGPMDQAAAEPGLDENKSLGDVSGNEKEEKDQPEGGISGEEDRKQSLGFERNGEVAGIDLDDSPRDMAMGRRMRGMGGLAWNGPTGGDFLNRSKSLFVGGFNTYSGATDISGGVIRLSPYQNRGGQWPYGAYSEAENWLNSLFGTLPPPAVGKRPPTTGPAWPEEAVAISKNLLRTSQLAAQEGGSQIDVQTDIFDPRFNNLTSQSESTFLTSARSWLIRSASDGGQTTVQWCDGKERGVFNRSFQLGRLRKAVEADLRDAPVSLSGFVLLSLKDSYFNDKVSVEHPADGQTLLTFRHDGDKNETVVLVDRKRNVVLSMETRSDGKTVARQQFGDFTEIAGAWWAGKVESRDDKGRVTTVLRQKVVPLMTADRFAQAMAQELAGREQVQFLRDPGETLLAAKKAVAAAVRPGGAPAAFDDHITLMMHFARSGQWTRVLDHLSAAEKLSGKAGLRWLRYAVLRSARRNEELKNLFRQEAASQAKAANIDELFLANYLLGQASGVLESNETIALLDALQPVFARQPARTRSMNQFKQQRAGWLANAGRGDEALSLYKELAQANPHDIYAQLSYVQNLQNRQEYEIERKWIEHLLSSDTPWLPSEIGQFHDYYSQSLRAQERYEELAAYLARWIEEKPEYADPYQQYLDALFFTERNDEAYGLLDRWFQEGRRDDVSPAHAARLQAAINWIFSQSDNRYNTFGQRFIDPRWQKQLVETAVVFCRHKTQFTITESILNDWRFQQTEANHTLRAELAKILAAHFDSLTVEQINRFAVWVRSDSSLVKEVWKDYARRLQARYAAISPLPGQEARAELKNQIALAIVNIVSFAAEPDEYLAVLRQFSREAPEKYRPYYLSQLFQTLLNQPWSEKYENEAWELLGQLGGGQTPERQLLTRIQSLHQLVDRMLAARNEVKAKAIEHAEKLTRTELRKKQADNLRKTREEFSDRLAREASKHRGELATWIGAEQLYLDVLLNRNLDQAAENCWKVLDAALPKIDGTSDDAAVLRAELDMALRNRYLVTLLNLTARKTASPALLRKMSDFIDANIARAAAADSENEQWKLLKFELLIALDNPQELEKALNDWIKGGDADNRWQVALGYILAEQGKLADAIARFEAVAAADELGPGDWQSLAAWYKAVNRRADYERGTVNVYKTMDEWRIDQWIRGQMQPWVYNQGQMPSQLNPEVILAFRALLAKSSNPQNYIGYQLHELYRASRDFRLLSCLADSIPGHTAGQIYPYLQAARTTIDEIREEAAVDSLVEHIAELRDKAANDVDRRAFDLLEAMTERRAAELRNQPGPHVDKAVAALQRAWKRSWSSGEDALMAEFLAALGSIPQERLAAEQLRQLAAFYANSPPDSQQRLDMACAWARALWNYNRRQPALDLLASEVNGYASGPAPAPGGGQMVSPLPLGEGQGVRAWWKPLCEQAVFQDYVSYLDQAGHFSQAVEILRQQLEQAEKAQNRRNLEARILEVHLSALRRRGQVGDLKGEALYRAVQKRILGQVPSGDAAFDARLIVLLSSLYHEAYSQHISGVRADTKSFAFEKLPALLKHQVQQYENLISDLCERVHEVCGPADGIAFVLDHYEHQPQWLRNKNNFWNAHGARLNNWRQEVKTLDKALSDRLLKVVLVYLREELLVRRTYNLTICYKSYPGEFWSDREADFLRFAEEIYAQNKKSGQIVVNVADYLGQGLGRYDRAIEILQIAQRDKLLDESGQAKLVNLLHAFSRFGESIDLLKMLVTDRPDNLEYRRLLMYAYFRTHRKDEMLALRQQTDKYFHQDNRWGEGPLAMLAGSCLQTEQFELSVGYYKELIPLHERTAPNRGIGDGTLSSYYGSEAQALAGLKKTPEAVEAACGAIVSWGANTQNRAQALESLRSVLRSCEKLDAYTAELDAQVAKSGVDNPLVRKALGQVYSERGQFDNALVQLRAACELQPNDAEIHQALVACCDKQNDKRGAIRQLLASVQLSRRDIQLYKEIGRRLAELHEDRESERGYTSIVEVLSSEAGSHTLLAEIREGQKRWSEAIDQWRQVARLQALEPTGLLRLAAAQLHEKQWDAARETVARLRTTAWPPRFGNVDYQIQELERRIRAGR